ncbi:MAG TPA: hypothetical protein VEQ59_03350 [Polyangiaceae bacterium]|nr:hypothetical protein [Polyangiaceae bacterium]
MTDSLCVPLHELLYRTRGRDWDYAFLLQPEPLLGEGWYALHRRIFSNVEPAARPLLLRGALGVGTGQPFLATAFTDRARRDYQDRPIAHYITWLGKAAEAAPGQSFGPALVEALAPAIDAVFELSPVALKRGETKPLDALLQSRFSAALPAQPLDLSGEPPTEIRWLGTIAP